MSRSSEARASAGIDARSDSTPARLLIADDHALLRTGMRAMLEADPPPEPSAARREEPGSLTPRELGVLRSLATGKTNRQIAHELHLSLSTVKRHLERIISKLGVSDRTQAAVKAVELGLIDPERAE